MNSNQHQELPAILGGDPINSDGSPTWPVLDLSASAEFQQVLKLGAWGHYHAQYTIELTSWLRQAYQIEHVILTSSGTAAVELALRGLKIQPGDEVLLAAYDFKSNFSNVLLLGAKPVLVDVQSEDGQIDVTRLESALTSRTKAIIASHLHGGTVNIEQLVNVAKTHGLPVIEDCCQSSPGARLGDVILGSHGDVTVLSFGGSKLLTAGRGGALICRRADIAQRVLLYTQRGNEAYPLSEIQAAVLLPQLVQLPELQQQRLRAVDQIRQSSLELGFRPFSSPTTAQPDFYKLGFFYDPACFGELTRDQFCLAIRSEGIPLDPGFPALHRIHARSRFHTPGDLRHADNAHAMIVTLHHPYLLREDASEVFAASLARIRQHTDAIRNYFRHRSKSVS